MAKRKKYLSNRAEKAYDKNRKRRKRNEPKDNMLYDQVNRLWKEKQAEKYNLKLETINIIDNTTKQSKELGHPSLFYNTNPDVNCFFNALSYV